ncbi:MAG: hypothetical protein JXA03_00590 [Bacteroidales bacterium]|nr:hypothetical protein [Bacteroidales bacterium]
MKTPLLYFFLLFLIIGLYAQAQVVSDFETGTEGWISEGDGDYLWESASGNPGGCFE